MGTFCDETDASTKQVQKCSKKMEVDEDLNLNTVACLRGRLLAERQASKVAKEKSESMANKLVELEKLVIKEIKLRDKSERKLKFLRTKLESLSISSKSRKLGNSDSSQNCENFSGSSSSSSSSISSNSKFSEKNETQNCVKNSALTENVVANHNISESQNSSSSSTKDCDSHITDSSSGNYLEHGCSSSEILVQNPNPSSESEDLKNDESRFYILSTKSSSVTDNESYEVDSFDNSLALVPANVNMTATSQDTNNHKSVNKSVFQALDALRVAKEKLQSSLGTKQMSHVGLN